MTSKPEKERLADLLDAVDGIELTPRDHQLIGWLAGWPQHTTDAVADLIRRARRGAYPDINGDVQTS